MYSLRYAPVLIYDVPKLIYDYSDVYRPIERCYWATSHWVTLKTQTKPAFIVTKLSGIRTVNPLMGTHGN